MDSVVIIILAGGTLIVALLTFLASITDLFKKSIPIDYGFLFDGETVDKLGLSTGDPAKPVVLRFRNSSKCTLTGVVLDMRFHRPLRLSATNRALAVIPGKTEHAKAQDNSYYHIRISELEMFGEENFDYRVELDTKGINPGTYRISVTAYSTQQNYKYKKCDLVVDMS